eukprot:TRINITY_DN42101_c0_g1_i1.p1 TRINITY_DN42101_c0_g1~~TRINITY_DN42101_c0_g1_i1.p1  ORF type:complete len:424 (-),score=63.83 TRINITY_DN42101_c0_g1_i1:126-1397(-)
MHIPGKSRADISSMTLPNTPRQQRTFQKSSLRLEPKLPLLTPPKDDSRDWRKLRPDETQRQLLEILDRRTKLKSESQLPHTAYEKSQNSLQCRALLGAVSAGNLQAMKQGSYWAPCFDDPGAVEVKHVRTPMSQVLMCTGSEMIPTKHSQGNPHIRVLSDCDILEACDKFRARDGPSRIAVVRFSALGSNYRIPNLTDVREAEFLVRTTYLHALETIQKHIHVDLDTVLEAGGVVHTTDVSVLRGPLKDGASWFVEAPNVDVFWVGLQRNPCHDEFGQGYADIADKARMKDTLEHLVHCATMRGVDSLVIPAPGSGGSQQTFHPPEDVGTVLRNALNDHVQPNMQVYVCQEAGSQAGSRWWSSFAAAFGRSPVRAVNGNRNDDWVAIDPRSSHKAKPFMLPPGWMRSLSQFPPSKWQGKQASK